MSKHFIDKAKQFVNGEFCLKIHLAGGSKTNFDVITWKLVLEFPKKPIETDSRKLKKKKTNNNKACY